MLSYLLAIVIAFGLAGSPSRLIASQSPAGCFVPLPGAAGRAKDAWPDGQGPAWPPACRVKGTAAVKATGLGIPYNNKFDLVYDLHIHVDPSSHKASVDVTHKGHTSTVKGTLINDSTIQLSLGQDCPQNFDGDGFSATLTGTVQKGFLTCTSGRVRMFAHLDATGKIVWNGLSVPVTGTVETDAHN
jgi:hypothetical protein